jgi:hypothetical protein
MSLRRPGAGDALDVAGPIPQPTHRPVLPMIAAVIQPKTPLQDADPPLDPDLEAKAKAEPALLWL